LPESAAGLAPAFDHHADLPSLVDGPAETRLIVGAVDGVRSPAHAYTPLFGAEVTFGGHGRTGAGRTQVRLDPDFEYAALTLSGGDAGTVDVDGGALPRGPLLYLGTGRHTLSLAGGEAARVLVIGGEPFAEEMIMWWNFIGRSHDEIVAAREDWMAGRRFGAVDYQGPPLPAPEMPITTLMPRGRTR
jgi:redox-sensitive bicupin YhaK (pirin superfamily)